MAASECHLQHHDALEAMFRQDVRLCNVRLAVASAGPNEGALSPSKSDVSTPAHLNALTRGQEQLMRSLDRLYMDRVFYIVSCCFMVCVLAATLPLELPEGFDWVLVVCRTVATLLLGFCLVMGLFWNAMEKSSLLEAQKSMRLLCRAYINMAGQCFAGDYSPEMIGEALLVPQGDQRV